MTLPVRFWLVLSGVVALVTALVLSAPDPLCP